jgi:hypothetical protein
MSLACLRFFFCPWPSDPVRELENGHESITIHNFCPFSKPSAPAPSSSSPGAGTPPDCSLNPVFGLVNRLDGGRNVVRPFDFFNMMMGARSAHLDLAFFASRLSSILSRGFIHPTPTWRDVLAELQRFAFFSRPRHRQNGGNEDSIHPVSFAYRLARRVKVG